MNTHRAEGEVLVDVVSQLCGIVQRLMSIVERLTADQAALDHPSVVNTTSKEAASICDERSRLIEAWKALESEQRSLALEPARTTNRSYSQPQRGSSQLATGTDTQSSSDQSSLDLRQFAYLRREYNRKHGPNS